MTRNEYRMGGSEYVNTGGVLTADGIGNQERLLIPNHLLDKVQQLRAPHLEGVQAAWRCFPAGSLCQGRQEFSQTVAQNIRSLHGALVRNELSLYHAPGVWLVAVAITEQIDGKCTVSLANHGQVLPPVVAADQ